MGLCPIVIKPNAPGKVPKRAGLSLTKEAELRNSRLGCSALLKISSLTEVAGEQVPRRFIPGRPQKQPVEEPEPEQEPAL